MDEVAIITDRDTDRPRGFAFVTMDNETEGRAAIEKMNGVDVDGRTITVNEARPKTDGGGRGGHRGTSGNSGGGRGGRW